MKWVQLLSSLEKMIKTSDRITPRYAGQALIDLISNGPDTFAKEYLLHSFMIGILLWVFSKV